MSTTKGINPVTGTTNSDVPATDTAPVIVPPAHTETSQEASDALHARLRGNLGSLDRNVAELGVTLAIIRETESWRLQLNSKGKPFQSLASYISENQAEFPALGKVISKAVVEQLLRDGTSLRAAINAIGGPKEMSLGTASAIRKNIAEAEATAAEAEAIAALEANDPAEAAKAKLAAKQKAAKAEADAKAKAEAKRVTDLVAALKAFASSADTLTTEQLTEVGGPLGELVDTLAGIAEARAEQRAKAEAEAKAKAEAERTSKGRTTTAKPKAPAKAPAPALAGAPVDPTAVLAV